LFLDAEVEVGEQDLTASGDRQLAVPNGDPTFGDFRAIVDALGVFGAALGTVQAHTEGVAGQQWQVLERLGNLDEVSTSDENEGDHEAEDWLAWGVGPCGSHH